MSKMNNTPSPESEERAREIVLSGEGIQVQEINAYGCGVDTHSRFIQVSVLVKKGTSFYEYRHEFSTDWPSLIQGREWAIQVVEQCSDPPLDLDGSIHYVVESTAVYHEPLVLAWGGTPSIINPVLAGATVKKTDVIDSSRMAYQDLTGIWRRSYLPSKDIKELRVLISERATSNKQATRTSNRINSTLTRFGFNLGINGSISRNSEVRKTVEAILSDDPSVDSSSLCPYPLPDSVKQILKKEYESFDDFKLSAKTYESSMLTLAKSLDWETGEGVLPGKKMIALLTTAPAVGEITATIWLANIITPNRFPNSKACAAYCGLDPSLQISAKHVTSRLVRKGNKELHSSLVQSASLLVKNHSELFGRWGYQLYLQTGSWKKSVNAVARKLAVALYHMQKYGQSFSYEKYNMLKEVVVIDIPITELVSLNSDFFRYIRLLKENGIDTTSQLVSAFYTFDLVKIKGIGKKCLALTKEFVDNQHRYKQLYHQLHSEENK